MSVKSFFTTLFDKMNELKMSIPSLSVTMLRLVVRWRGQILIFIFLVTIPDLLQFTTGRQGGRSELEMT